MAKQAVQRGSDGETGYHGGALGRGLPAGFTAVNRGGIGTGGSNGVFGRIDLCPQNVDSKGECTKIRKNNKFQKMVQIIKRKIPINDYKIILIFCK
jgi:hypothetical protein